MCGILGVIGTPDLKKVLELSSRMSHRGPDERDYYQAPCGSVITHERLSIIDLSTGKQPIKGTNTAYVVHNGEIYNHALLRATTLRHHSFHTTCDSEVIVHLYEEYGNDFCNMLDGIFAFIVIDNEKFIVGRDPIGVKPLYYGRDKEGNLYFSSEMKSLHDACVEFEAFPPGHYYTPQTGFVRYFQPEWEDHTKCVHEADLANLRQTLSIAVEKRLMSDVPLGVLLSGGLDSSLISSIAQRLMKAQGLGLHSFSVGFQADAPDLIAAQKVADFIGTTHHNIVISLEQGIAELERIIWHLESYDVTTIRASTPMYFLSKAITEMGIKVVLSGEGADEILGGYLYFFNAPSDEEFQKETISRIKRLSTADCLRADKATMAHGLEARVPFLDKSVLSTAMRFKPETKRPSREKGIIEKNVLRMAFDDKENPYLPQEILWRQKEQFSDGVGYNWIDGLIAFCNTQVSDELFATREERFPYNTPTTKEAFYYRSIFEKHYPSLTAAKTVMKWVPKWQKNDDPSGRVCDNHDQKVEALKHAVVSNSSQFSSNLQQTAVANKQTSSMTFEEFMSKVPQTISHPKWGNSVLVVIKNIPGHNGICYRSDTKGDHFGTSSLTWENVYISVMDYLKEQGYKL